MLAQLEFVVRVSSLALWSFPVDGVGFRLQQSLKIVFKRNGVKSVTADQSASLALPVWVSLHVGPLEGTVVFSCALWLRLVFIPRLPPEMLKSKQENMK